MLALSFHIGVDRFALPCADIVEVVPRILLRAGPRAPVSVAGTFTYRGAIVPVVDLCMLVTEKACPLRLSSRIIVVRFSTSAGTERLLGLLAERVVETITLDRKTSAPTGIHVPDAPYLGDVYVESGAPVQLLAIGPLLQGPLRSLLLGDGATA